MMQTVKDAIDMPACTLHLSQQSAVKPLQSIEFEVSFGDARLVGNDGNAKAQAVQKAELCSCKWRVDYSGVLVIDQAVDHAIPVEENCTVSRSRCQRGPDCALR